MTLCYPSLEQERASLIVLLQHVRGFDTVWPASHSPPESHKIPLVSKVLLWILRRKKPGYKDSGINNFLSLSNTNREVKQ